MNKEQFEQIMEYARLDLETYTSWRLGQVIFNKFNLYFPKETASLVATEYDCFYNNAKINAFIEKIFELTNATEECRQFLYGSPTYNFLINKYKA